MKKESMILSSKYRGKLHTHPPHLRCPWQAEGENTKPWSPGLGWCRRVCFELALMDRYWLTSDLK